MTKEMRQKIKSLGKFYYHFNFGGAETRKVISHRGSKNWERIRNVLTPILSEFKKPIVVDVGCNMGVLSYEMSKLGAHVIGIENDRKYFEQAKFFEEYIRGMKQPWDIELVFGDILKYDKASDGVNVITLFGIIYWLAPDHDTVIDHLKGLFPKHRYIVLQGNLKAVEKSLIKDLPTRKGMEKFLEKHGYSIYGTYDFGGYQKPVVVGERL